MSIDLGHTQLVDEVSHTQGTDPETYSMNGHFFLGHLGRGDAADTDLPHTVPIET